MTNIHRIAIVGAGPSGVAFAKYFLAEHVFDIIDMYEQRNNTGGIWNLSGNELSKNTPAPQTDPNYGNDIDQTSRDEPLTFESPLYNYLETNIPKRLMAYSDFPFNADLPLFPGHVDVLKYLDEYAKPVRHLIHFNTQVMDVQPVHASTSSSALDQKWNVVTKDLRNGIEHENQYDAVVVANGHYTVPHIPEIAGLAEWQSMYPGTVLHSKAYRRPEDFTGQKVLVVGNSASGLDIAAQIAPHADTPVYLASRSASQLAPSGSGPSWRKDIAEVERFLTSEGVRAVRTKDGQVIGDLDSVIFATGYFYSFPFLTKKPRTSLPTSEADSPSASLSSSDSISPNNDLKSVTAQSEQPNPDNLSTSKPFADLITTGLRTHHVYKHFLHIHYPTLAFPVLNLKVIPFPLAENQAAVLARIWSGRLDLPSLATMEQWEKDEEKRLIDANRVRAVPNTASGDSVGTLSNPQYPENLRYEGGFHTLVYPEDAHQINSLHQWALSARMREGLENHGIGKASNKWDEEMVWLRGQFPNIRASFAKLGENRASVTNLDSLGEEWVDGFRKWAARTSEEDKRNLFRRAAVQGW